MRQISATAMEALMAQQTDKVFLTTISISHPDLASDLHFVNDMVSFSFDGNTYLPAAFEFRLPNDTEDNVPQGQIVLDNTDQQIIQAVRGLKAAPEITINIVLADPPTRELGPIHFKLKEFSYNAETIRGALGYAEEFLNQAFPKDTMNPRSTPGLF